MARATAGVPDAERVTLISSDGVEFAIDKKSARKSGFIRSMLGEATQQAGGSKDANDAAAKTAEIMTSSSHTAPATSHASSAAETADGGGDPAGYVNPFAAADDGAAGNGKDDDDMGLASGFAEAQSNTVHLNNIRSAVLEKVVEYLQWNAKYSDAPKDADIPPFEPRIPPDLALELLIAADYLDA